MKKNFYGWWITGAAFLSFGFSVGIPYYNIPFFYDYFERAFGWSRGQITLGFPLAALFTIWVGPLLVPRFSPRKLILAGTTLTAMALAGFGYMNGALRIYYLLWVLYTAGYIFSGPIPHQIIVSHWFRKNRGKAMGIVYVGVGLMGSLGSYLVKPLTEKLGFQTALLILGGMMFLAWPLVLFVLKDKPSEVGQYPDGALQAAAEVSMQSRGFGHLLGSFPFWLLLIGSFCSIGSIGAIIFHMKFVFLDEGFKAGEQLNSTWRTASILILWSSIGGRLSIGYLADRFPKKYVMTATYFVVAATIPLLLIVKPPETPYVFSLLFGFAMGADYMLIPLMAADQFGVNTLARAMAVILPVNTIAQTWFPYFVSLLRERFGSYTVAMGVVFGVAMVGALAIFLLPRHREIDETFTYKSLDELRQSCSTVGTSHVGFEEDPEKIKSVLARKVAVGTFTVGNSMAIHPMEGCDGTLDGRPGGLTWRRYERFGRGGAKLIWFEATAVVPEARANPRQLWITKDNVGDFARLLEMTRRVHREVSGTADDLLEPLQLTHSGRYSVPRRIIAYHNPYIDQSTKTPADYAPITDDELEHLEGDYVAAARLAVEAGFRAIDIKATHGYLLNELLGAKTREGRYGGSLENRTRLIRNVLGKLRAEFGDRLILCMRLGCFDGIPYGATPTLPYPHGFGVNAGDPFHEDLDEVKQAIGWFRDSGLQLLNVSLGCPYYNPHIGRPFEMPDEGNYEQPEHPLLGVDRHFRIAGELQRAFPDLPMVGTGYSWLQVYCLNAAAHNLAAGNIRFFGLGRGSLAFPDFARAALEHGRLEERRVCKTLTYCTYLMRQKNNPLGQVPTGCPPFDREAYGPIIKEVRAAKRAAAQ